MDINYELYKVFYQVAKSLSFSEASKHLFISQSAVSQSVKSLEKKLDQQLFIRSTKKVQLTPEGEILYKHIEPAIKLIERGESQILDPKAFGSGQLRIGTTDTICRYLLIPHLKQFHKQYPNIHLKVTCQISSACVSLLRDGEVDLILTNNPNPMISNTETVIPYKKFRDIFVAGNAYSNLRNQSLSFEDLQKSPIMMLDSKSTTSSYLHSCFRQRQLELIPEIELSSNDLLLDMARIGLGIAFIPDFCLPADDPDLFQLDVSDDIPARQIILAHSSAMPLPTTAQIFIDQLLN